MAKVDVLEAKIHAIGAELFAATKGTQPSIFDKGFWNGKIIDYCMAHEAFKVEMFRFVDVMPMLRDADNLARHVKEYFTRQGLELPAPVKTAVLGATAFGGLGARMAAGTIEKNVLDMARRFVVGSSPTEALPALKKLRDDNITFTVDLLGEATVSEEESEAYQKRYLEVIDVLTAEKDRWRDNDILDRGPDGPLPKVNVSIKVSALYSQMDSLAHDASLAALKQRLRPILLRARETGAFVNLDLEQYALKDLTFDLFMQLVDEPAFADYPHWGVVIQAYLVDSFADAERLIKWAKKRKVPTTVRLVKGAYWESETIWARQRGHAAPVFTRKQDTDANYERVTRLLLDAYPTIRLAVASHNIRSIAHAIAYTRERGLPDSALELQSLIGMAEPIRAGTVKMGLRQRVYAPVGELLPGMAYFVRRLLENTSNEGFMRQSFVEGASMDELLRAPQASAPVVEGTNKKAASEIPPFRNETPTGWASADNRQRMLKALEKAQKNLGRELPVVVDGKEIRTGQLHDSHNPSRSEQVVARQHLARGDEAEAAVKAARAGFAAWRDTPATERAQVLLRAAQLMRERRFDLDALVVLEAGKTWREADADVAEAIDYLEYYAREVIRLGTARRMQPYMPGEDNLYLYEARGVAVVLGPFNFPLALLCNMTAAALGAGNTVVMKPSRATPAVGYELFRILREAKAPAGALHHVPGTGAEIGRLLVEHRDVDLIAFTGSTEAGVDILQRAAVLQPGQQHIKSVICEMSAKNAIIVDDDADLDEAVRAVLAAAFGYAGQKCSACSRAVVLDKVYEAFAGRLIEATRSLQVGEATDPATIIPPVIDADARQRVLDLVRVGRDEATVLLEVEPPPGGCFVGPVIFGEVPRQARIAQEEIFGPVLCMQRARDFDEALAIAMDSRYALTGGLFSRSPAHIEQARREFRVGNLYINRSITGSTVERHPYGGLRLSGMGSKSGGPDYLRQFMHARSIAENSMRRGFAPEAEAEAGDS
ncbi:MAG: proline dehydrogenase family protein [Pseudomonadota bacterium]